MVNVGVGEVARHLGLSEQEVRRRLNNGSLRGEKFGGVWLVDPSSIPSAPRSRGRPLSRESAWALASMASGLPLDHLDPVHRHRSRKRWEALVGSTNPIPLIRSWLRSRADNLRLSGVDVDQVRDDPRIYLSGVSHPSAGISAPDIVEGYVLRSDVDQLRNDHLLAPGGRVNVVLSVVDDLPAQLPWLMVVADLADGGPRELQQAEILVAKMIKEHAHQ